MFLSRSENQVVKGLINEIGSCLEIGSARSLYAGSAGQSLFFESLGPYSKKSYKNTIQTITDQLAEDLSNGISNPSLATGYSGLLWLQRHLKFDLEPEVRNFYADLLTEQLTKESWSGNSELIRGLAGITVNVTDGIGERGSKRNAKLLVDGLEKTSRLLKSGRVWRSKVNGPYNLGLAHGVPGVWVALGLLFEKKIERKRCAKMFNESIQWFSEIEREFEEGLPNVYSSTTKPEPARLAWCYGDVGAGLALMISAKYFSHREAEELSLKILTRSTQRHYKKSGVVDAEFCHGSSGLALMYANAFRISNEKIFREAASFWYRKTLEFRIKADKRNFLNYLEDRATGELQLGYDTGLLEGLTGIGLSLISALEEEAPHWGKLLMVSP